jgi:hypothetical protein
MAKQVYQLQLHVKQADGSFDGDLTDIVEFEIEAVQGNVFAVIDAWKAQAEKREKEETERDRAIAIQDGTYAILKGEFETPSEFFQTRVDHSLFASATEYSALVWARVNGMVR